MQEKIDTEKLTLIQKLKELAAEAEDVKVIVSDLIQQEESDNRAE